MHLSEGQLKAYQDGERSSIPPLSAAEQELVRGHLAGCARCQEKAARLSARAQAVQVRLDVLAQSVAPLSTVAARPRLQDYVNQKEKQTMWNKLNSRSFRPAWAVLALIAVLAVALSFPQVRAFAGDFLGLFRVQQVTIVPFNPANLPASYSNAGASIDKLLSDTMKTEQQGTVQEVATADEASAAAGISVRLPDGLGTPQLTVQPGTHLEFKVDLPRIRSILDAIDRKDVLLPNELDGATVTADLPKSVTAQFGDCQRPSGGKAEPGTNPMSPAAWGMNCVVLVQMPSPTISAPAGLDIAAIGKAFLQVMGMTADEADRFSQTVDWATTLVIPVPNNATYQDVQVDGVQGAWIQQDLNQSSFQNYMLVWAKDGLVYALTGRGDIAQALSIANSLK